MAKAFTEIEIPRKTSKIGFIPVEVFDTDEAWTCQQLISPRRHCPVDTDDTCEFCGCWTCYKHFDLSKRITIDGNGMNQARQVSPCKACARLPKDDLLRLRALRLEMNAHL